MNVKLATLFSVSSAFFASAANDDKVAWMLQTNLLERTERKADAALPNVLILGDSMSITCV